MKKICILRNLLFLTVTIYCVLHFSALAEAEKWAISGTAATDDNIVTYFYVTANFSTASLTLTQDGKGRMRFIHNNGWGKTVETKDASSYARYTVNYKLSDNISWNYNDPYSWTPNSSFGKEWDDKNFVINFDAPGVYVVKIMSSSNTGNPSSARDWWDLLGLKGWDCDKWLKAPTWSISSSQGCQASTKNNNQASNNFSGNDQSSNTSNIKSFANVIVEYRFSNGDLISSYTKELKTGTHTIDAKTSFTSYPIADKIFTVIGSNKKTVTVYSNGSYSPNPVIFYYNEKQAATSTKTPTPASNQFYIWVNAGSTGNIRSAPTASGTWLGSEKEGTRLTAYDRVASQDSGGKDWYKISYNGQIAYISTTTSSTSKPSIRSATATPTTEKQTPIAGSSKSSASSSSSETSHTKTWQWSGWITKRQAISDPNTMKEESRIAKYGWWAAKCKNCGQHNPYWGSKTKCINCGEYLPKENVISLIEYTDDLGNPQKIFGRNGGRYINSLPYWRESGDNDIIEYRYAVLQ